MVLLHCIYSKNTLMFNVLVLGIFLLYDVMRLMKII